MRPTDTKQPFLDFRGIPKVPGKNESSLEEGKKSAPKQKNRKLRRKNRFFSLRNKKNDEEDSVSKKIRSFSELFLAALGIQSKQFFLQPPIGGNVSSE